MKIRVNLRGTILTQGPKMVIFNDSCSTFCYSILLEKDPNCPFLYSNLPVLLDVESGGGTLTQGPKIVISLAHVALSYLILFDLE